MYMVFTHLKKHFSLKVYFNLLKIASEINDTTKVMSSTTGS